MEEVVTSVVQHSTSINNAFISTVDHLPCDVIRSLWFVQACNISIEKKNQRLDKLLLQLQKDPRANRDEIASELCILEQTLEALHSESILEAKALQNQLITHKLSLEDELQQLQTLAKSANSAYTHTNAASDHEALRLKLKEHYKKHPLISQREALKEHQLNQNTALTSGLKLILKIPKKSKKLLKQPKVHKSPIEIGKLQKSSQVKKMVKLHQKHQSVSATVRKTPDLPPAIDPAGEEDSQVYCFCKQPSFGNMIGCDNEISCPNGDWFHYKCVGLLNRVEALKYTTGKEKWFCSDQCRKQYWRNRLKSESAKVKKRKSRR